MLISDFEKIQNQIGFNDGINGKNEFFNSVVLVLLIPINGEYYFVFEKRARNIRQGGEICFPGGKIEEKDATLEETAIRETTEELGIPGEKIRIIGRLDTVLAPMGATVDAFIGIAEVGLEDVTVNVDEVEKVITIPVSYFRENEPEQYSTLIKVFPSYIDEKTGREIVLFPAEELGLPSIYRKPWGKYKHRVYVYRTDNGVIWGITARLVYDLINKINDLDK